MGEDVNSSVHARYAPDFGRAKLGAVQFDVAVRDICPDSVALCDREWRPFRVVVPQILSEGLQAHVWFGARDRDRPVKIVNPTHIRNGTFPLPSERSPLACRTATSPGEQASCVLDAALARPFLAGARDVPEPLTLKGVVAEHCMHVSTSFASPYGAFVDASGTSHDVWRETRLTVSGRLSWPD